MLNFEAAILDYIKKHVTIRVIKDHPDIKVQLLLDGEVISEDKEEIFLTRNDE